MTAEPLPTRLASIAQGEGDIDSVYHVNLENLRRAVHTAGTPQQKDCIETLVKTGRIADLADLPRELLL